MAVIRVEKNKNYTCMANYHLRDKNLSLKAKGLMSVILSLPDNWKYSMAGLVAICKEGESSVKAAFKELEKAGFVTVSKLYPNQTESGRIEYVYTIHEEPTKQERCTQGVENLEVVSQEVENQGQLNTDVPSIDKPNTKDKTKKEEKKSVSSPTIEEVRAYVQEKKFSFDADEFFAYYASQGWRKANGQKVVSWKQCCVTWERREQKRKQPKPTQRKMDFSVYSQPKPGDSRTDGTVTEVYQADGTWKVQEQDEEEDNWYDGI